VSDITPTLKMQFQFITLWNVPRKTTGVLHTQNVNILQFQNLFYFLLQCKKYKEIPCFSAATFVYTLLSTVVLLDKNKDTKDNEIKKLHKIGEVYGRQILKTYTLSNRHSVWGHKRLHDTYAYRKKITLNFYRCYYNSLLFRNFWG